MQTAPDELQCYPFFLRIPPVEVFPEELHGQVVLDFVVFHTDSGPDGAAALGPLVELGEPVFSAVGPQSYSSVMEAFDAGLPGGQRYGSRAHYLKDITDDVIDTIMTHAADMVGPFTVAYIDALGGAPSRVDPSATAFPHRKASFGFHIISGWMDSEQDEEVSAWADAFHEAMSQHATGGVYVNLLGPDETHRIPAAYGNSYDRLAELKKVWDPNNLFRSTYNVKPAG